jgi:DNA polymerase III alpha subunit (gram-positive type)
MRLLAFDVEATGLDLVNDLVIEVGATLWDTERKAPLLVFNKLIKRDDIKLSTEVSHLTGISTEDLFEFGFPAKEVVENFEDLVERADVLMAHNAIGYDLPMMRRLYGEVGVKWQEKTTIDTLLDLPGINNFKSRSLSHLLTHNEILNYFPHRAFSDALCLAKMSNRYDLNTMIKRAESRAILVIAKVDYHNKDKAKDSGFYWQPQRKLWYKIMREFDYSEDDYNFLTEVQEYSSL